MVSAFCAVAETPSQSVRRSAAAREGPFSVSVAIVGFVVVITIVGADKAEQIEERRRGELQKRNEAVRGRGRYPKSDRAGIAIRQRSKHP